MARYENKYKFDPGRLNHKIEFYKDESVPDGYGGATPSNVLKLTTKAGRMRISSKTAAESGLEVMNQNYYYIVRKRNDFNPEIDMTVKVDGSNSYTIKGIDFMDDPTTYIRLTCVHLQD